MLLGARLKDNGYNVTPRVAVASYLVLRVEGAFTVSYMGRELEVEHTPKRGAPDRHDDVLRLMETVVDALGLTEWTSLRVESSFAAPHPDPFGYLRDELLSPDVTRLGDRNLTAARLTLGYRVQDAELHLALAPLKRSTVMPTSHFSAQASLRFRAPSAAQLRGLPAYLDAHAVQAHSVVAGLLKI